MDPGVVAGVEKPVESLRLRLLGSLELSRGGDVLKLPASRKVRALLGYLVLAQPARRAHADLRTVVGRAQRSARRVALVSLEDPRPAR